MKTNPVFLLIGLLLLVSACLPTGNQAERATDGLAGTKWALAESGPADNLTIALPETAVFNDQPFPSDLDFLLTFANYDGTPFTIQLPEEPPQTNFPVAIQMTESGSYRIATQLACSP